MSEQLLVNLRKAHAARLWWRNQHGMKAKHKPEAPTVHGVAIDANALAMRIPDAPDETLLERATRRNLLDVWTPVCRVDFNSRVRECFEGTLAEKIYGAWKGVVFKQKKETA